MSKYLIESSYTAEGVRGLQKDKASGRKQAVTKVVESLEGKVEAVYFALGEYDIVVLPIYLTSSAPLRCPSASRPLVSWVRE